MWLFYIILFFWFVFMVLFVCFGLLFIEYLYIMFLISEWGLILYLYMLFFVSMWVLVVWLNRFCVCIFIFFREFWDWMVLKFCVVKKLILFILLSNYYFELNIFIFLIIYYYCNLFVKIFLVKMEKVLIVWG